jgi:YD repeat-containing protein
MEHTNMKKMNFFFLSVALFLFAHNADALVDLKNANYSEAAVDLSIPGTGYDLRVERAFNSRTLFNGMFGFGWCSEFETSLEITPEGNLKLTECGAGQEVLYETKGFSEKDIDKSVKAIMEKAKQENLTSTAPYFSALEKRLKVESSLRSEYASKYGISRTVPDKMKFLANGREADYIEKNGNYYSRVTPEGNIQKFKMNGKLEKIYDRNGNYLTLTYEGKLLTDVTDNSGRKLTMNYFENGKIKQIKGPSGISAEYKFKNLNDLSWVKMANGQVYTFEYDDLHNLLKVNLPDKKTREMTYNKNKDWITSFKDVDGCVENYDYKDSNDNPKDHYTSSVIKKCKNQVVLKASYEFWFETKDDHTGKYLKKGRTDENGAVTDIVYNELGKPLTITRGKRITKFDYYENGLLRKKITPDGVGTLLKYDNPLKKVSRIERGSKATDFTYDAKGNLLKALNSDGQKIILTYDLAGRVAGLEDQAKRRIFIKYDPRVNKPSVIDREGVGAISVVYNDKGEISKVSSPAGSSVAVQVASTFNNLLDLIQPAGVNLSF